MRPLYQTSFWLPIHLITFYGPVAIRLFAPITYIFIGATSSVQVIVISLSLLACIALKILYAEIVQYFGSTHNRTLLVATYSICVAGSLMVVTVYILQKGNLELKSDCKILVGDNNHLKMSDVCKKESHSFCALTEFDNLFLDNGDETSTYKVNFVLFAILESAQNRTIIALQHKNIIGNHIMINLENIYYKNDQNDNEESTKIEPVFVGYCVDSSNVKKKLNNCLLGVLAVFFMIIFSSIIQTDFEVIRDIEYKMHQKKRYLSFEVSFLVRELSFTFFAVLACFLYSTITKNTTNQYNRILLILICLYTVPLLLSIYNMVFFSETYTDVGLTYFIRTPFPLLIKMFSPRMIVFGIFCTFIGFGTLMMELLTLIKSSSYGFKLQYFGLALIIRFIASTFPSLDSIFANLKLCSSMLFIGVTLAVALGLIAFNNSVYTLHGSINWIFSGIFYGYYYGFVLLGTRELLESNPIWNSKLTIFQQRALFLTFLTFNSTMYYSIGYSIGFGIVHLITTAEGSYLTLSIFFFAILIGGASLVLSSLDRFLEKLNN